jgi:hypothetical protein
MRTKGSRIAHLVDWHLTAEPFALLPIFLSHGINPALGQVTVQKSANLQLVASMMRRAATGPLGTAPFPCISPPRGVPDDLAPELKALYDRNARWAFCASWLLLEELRAFPWHATRVLRRAVIDPKIAHLFRSASGGEPDPHWPRTAPNVYSHQMLLGRGIEVSWWESCAEAVGSEFLSIIGKLQGHGGPGEVRTIFWFDF